MTRDQIIERLKVESIEGVADSLGVSIRRIYQIVGPTRKNSPAADRAAEINQLRLAGMSETKIAERMKISRKTLKKIQRPPESPLNARVRTLSEVNLEFVAKRARAGHQAGTIAREIGKSKSTVAKAIRRLGLDQPADEWRDAMIAAMRERGLTPNAVAGMVVGLVSHSHVCEYLSRRQAMSTYLAQHVAKALGKRLV